MSKPVLVLASRNQGKLRELRELLRGQVPGLDVDTQVVDAATAGAGDPVEDQVTFQCNALKKAREISGSTGLVALADDSGLSVDVLGGAPGIFSARWSGVHGNDEANIDLLLGQLDPYTRGATFALQAFGANLALAEPLADARLGDIALPRELGLRHRLHLSAFKAPLKSDLRLLNSCQTG